MPNPTLKDIVNTFTEAELSLEVPMHFSDVSASEYSYVNQYNTYLSSGDFSAAEEYRKQYANIIDKYIFDAKKMNMLITLIINSYLFSKEEKSAKNTDFDNSNITLKSSTVQSAIEELYSKITQSTYVNSAFSELSESERTIKSGEYKLYNYNFITILPNNYKVDHVIFGATNAAGLICQDIYILDNTVNFGIFNAGNNSATFDHLSFRVFFTPNLGV